MDQRARERRRIGPWRLLEMLQATMPWRAASLGLTAGLPEYGPPDAGRPQQDPSEELPGSYIGEGERHQAVQRERARRFVRTPRPGR